MININNVDLTVFANVCPYKIKEGELYPVTLGMTVLDDIEIHVSEECRKELIRFGDSFRYEIKGVLLENGFIDAGILIDAELTGDYRYLYGQYVRVIADRISAEFL